MSTHNEMLFRAIEYLLLTLVAIAFFIWALIAMLLEQPSDSVTLALIGIGFAIISK